MMLKYLIQTSIFRYSNNYGSVKHETRIKDAVNMGNLICLLVTGRTLKQEHISRGQRGLLANPDEVCIGSVQIFRNE